MKRLELLGVLFWVQAGLCLAGAACFALVGLLGGMGLLEPSEPLEERLAGVAGAAILGLGTGALGIGHLVVGTGLRRRRAWARTAGLVLGVVDILCCCLAPLGTALGVFALIVLLADDVVALFPP